MEIDLQKVDHSALRTDQAAIITLSILAFILNLPWAAGIIALVMALGTVRQRPDFGFLYERVLRPRGWAHPEVLPDNPEPHSVAQGFGAIVLSAGVIGLFLGIPAVGWGLVWLVIALAALNLFGGFCVGCALYYWLFRLQVPGFIKAPPVGTPPGMRPKA